MPSILCKETIIDLASAVEIYQKLLPSPKLFDQELAHYKLHYMLILKDNRPDSWKAEKSRGHRKNKREAEDTEKNIGGLFKYLTRTTSESKVAKNSFDARQSTEFYGKTFENFKIVAYNNVFDAQTLPSNGDCFLLP